MCGEPLDAENTSRCHFCGGYFHMAWSTQTQSRNCGSYWLNQMSCGLAFICAGCNEARPVTEDQSCNQCSTS